MNGLTSEAHFLEGFNECVFAFDVEAHQHAHAFNPSDPLNEDSFNNAEFMEAKIRSLQDKVPAAQKGHCQFDSVNVSQRQSPPKQILQRPRPAQPPFQPPVSGNEHRPRSPPPHIPCTQNPPPNVFGRPGARAGADRQPPPPTGPQGPMKPIEMPPKSTDDSKHQFQSAIELLSGILLKFCSFLPIFPDLKLY